MAYADPQIITVNAVNKSLNRIGSSDNSSNYRLDDGTNIWGLEASHSSTKGRVGHLLKITQTRTAADVYQPALNTISKMSAHVVLNVPLVGFTPTEQVYLMTALTTKLTADTSLIMGKLINGES